jgi:hypothetical protein
MIQRKEFGYKLINMKVKISKHPPIFLPTYLKFEAMYRNLLIFL